MVDMKMSNIDEWRDKEPDEESQQKVKSGFKAYLKKSIGKIPFARKAA